MIPIWCWRGRSACRATVNLLQRLGRRVVIVPQPPDLDGRAGVPCASWRLPSVSGPRARR